MTVVDAGDSTVLSGETVGDALALVPGVLILATGSRGGTSNAFIRGGDSNFTLVLLDGMPVNDSTEITGGSVNLQEASADFVERIEIVRGPITSHYGPASLSGVVQLFTRRGTRAGVHGDVGADAGTASFWHGFARVSGVRGSGAWSFGGTWSQEKQRLGEESFRGLELWGTADIPLAVGTRLSFTAHVAHASASDYPESSGGPIYGSGLVRHSDPRDDTLSSRLESGASSSHHQRLLLGVFRRRLARSSPAVLTQVPASTESTSLARVRIAYDMAIVSGANTAIQGGILGQGEFGTNASILHLPLALGGNTPGDYRKTEWTLGAYVGVQHQRGPVLLDSALRVDVPSHEAVQFNPHVGLSWRIDKQGKTRARASGASASKTPSFSAVASPRELGGNPQLHSEHALGADIGIEQALFAERVHVSATVFWAHYRDLIDFDFRTFQIVNRARVSAHGAEFAVSWRPHDSLLVDLPATWLSTKEMSGVPLLHRPRWHGGVRFSWLPFRRAALRIQTSSQSSSLDHELPVPQRDRVSGYSVAMIAASWRLNDHWLLRSRVDNVTDRRYETLIGFQGPRRAYSLGCLWTW